VIKLSSFVMLSSCAAATLSLVVAAAEQSLVVAVTELSLVVAVVEQSLVVVAAELSLVVVVTKVDALVVAVKKVNGLVVVAKEVDALVVAAKDVAAVAVMSPNWKFQSLSRQTQCPACTIVRDNQRSFQVFIHHSLQCIPTCFYDGHILPYPQVL
jgi:hypothetical protein